ncbi:MAG: hypothetical protein V4569_04460 [Pseudomonadota bacterium]
MITNGKHRVQQLNGQINGEKLRLHDVQDALGACLMDLSERSDDPALMAEFEKLASRERELTGKIETLNRLLTRAHGLDSADSRLAALQESTTAAQRAKEACQHRVHLATEIQATIEQFAAQMARYADVDKTCLRETREAVGSIMDRELYSRQGNWHWVAQSIPMFDALLATLRDHSRDLPAIQIAERAADRTADRIDHEIANARRRLRVAA